MAESTPIESERRIATVMFADIAGFTAMSEKMDPEQVTCTMNDCFCMMEECIQIHGGTIDKFIGDCVMVLFGVPKALEDAPQKAVNTAIELRNRLHKFNGDKKLDVTLDIHIGINTGPVVAGMIGGSEKQEFTVMGDTVNIASRLEDASQVGQILVGPATYKATRAGFKYKTPSPITLKGRAEPVLAYELISVKEILSRMQAGADRMISSVMVGRETELNRLEHQIMKVINGEGSIVSVMGEAGIGKSRLIAELKNREAIKGVALLEGRAVSMGANLGYHLIIDLMKNWARITEDDSGTAAFAKLESAIRGIYPEALGEILPFVATLMGMKLVGRYAERIKGIEGEALEKLILKNVRDLIIRGTQRTPLVVILEDLHWADTSSIDFLESLFRLAAKEQIVFINVFRPGYTDTGDRIIRTIQENSSDKYTEITLPPLDEKQTETLIMNLLCIKGFAHRLKEQIIERAGGNPYFIEEVVRSFIDEGAVVMKGAGFEVTEKLSTMSVPRTINEVLMARIDRLDQKTRDLVKTASVIGRNFFYRILAEVARTIDDMDSRLEYLEEIQLIRERKRMEELEYLFKHALAQEVAYDSILLQRRKELHKNVADSIEKVFNERLHEFYGMLAYHYSHAEDLDKAEEYLIKAGEESLKASASAEALHYCQQALDLYLSKYGKRADPEKVTMLEKNIALALFHRGQYAEAVKYFNKVLTFYGETVPKNPVAKTLKTLTSFYAFLVSFYLPFLRWKKEPTPKVKEIFNLSHKKGQAISITDSVGFFIQNLYFHSFSSKYNPRKIDNGLGIIATASPIFSWTGISLTLSKRVIEFIRDKIDPGDVKSVLYYNVSEILHNYISGIWPEEATVNQDLIEKNLGMGEFFFATSSLVFIGLLNTNRGKFTAAQSTLRMMSDIGETYDNDYAKVMAAYVGTRFLMKYRGLNIFFNQADAGIQLTQHTGFRVWLVSLYAFKAQIKLLLNDVHGAVESLGYAKTVKSEERTFPMQTGDLLLSNLALELYLYEEAMSRADKIAWKTHCKNAFKAGAETLKLARRLASIRTESLRLMGVCCWISGKQLKSLLWLRKAVAEGTRLNDRLELSRTYFEIGKRLLEPKSKYKEMDGIKAEEYLEKARVMFVEMDLQWDLDEMKKLRLHMST